VRGFDIDVAYAHRDGRNVARWPPGAARREPQRDETASLADVRKVVRLLRGMSLDERRRCRA